MIEPKFRKRQIVEKGWGKEEIFANNDKYCGKLLYFNKGAKFSNHYHLIKEESFLIFYGKIKFIYLNLENAERIEKILSSGDIIDIPVGFPHKIEAIESSMIVEVSTHHEDSDSYRIEKGDSQK